MATIELIRKRVGNDIKMAVRLVDSEVAVDWTTVSKVKAVMVSDQQRIMMGECRIVGPDTQDATKLLMVYPAVQPQYLGVARLVLTVTYFGNVSTLDIPVLIFVASTAEEGTGTVEVEAPADLDPEDNNLELELEDIDTSVIQAAIDAANDAAEAADAAIAKLKGGTTGQIMTKKSNAELDIEWQDPQQGGRAEWGHITGDLDDQTDLKNALDAKQDTISNLATIEAGAAAGATAVQPGDLASVATSGDYDDLLNKPSIPAAQVQSDWDQADSGAVDYIKNKPTIPAAQVNSDWDAVSGVAQILNKPTIPDVTGKADKVAGATAGDFAALDANGNLVDSGSKAGDFATAAQGAKADTAYQMPSGGIPSTDLASAVQTSLGKADTALQSADFIDFTDQELQTAIDTAFAGL